MERRDVDVLDVMAVEDAWAGGVWIWEVEKKMASDARRIAKE